MDRERVAAWVAAYERAWRTPGTEPLHELFTADAAYRTAPFEEPFRGLDVIAAMWEAGRTSPDEEFELDFEVVACERERAVVRLDVRYGDPTPRVYRDLWVLEFDEDGRCASFEEWPFWPRGSAGTYESGPT